MMDLPSLLTLPSESSLPVVVVLERMDPLPSAETSVTVLLEMMRRANLQSFPVVDGRRRLVGIVRRADCYAALSGALEWPAPGPAAPVHSPGHLPDVSLASHRTRGGGIGVVVGEVVRSPAPALSLEDPVDRAERLMAEWRLDCVPVVAGERVVGIVRASGSHSSPPEGEVAAGAL